MALFRQLRRDARHRMRMPSGRGGRSPAANIGAPATPESSMPRLRPLVLAAVLALAPLSSALAADSLRTVAEKSGFQRTGRYDEVIALCDRFEQAYPGFVDCIDFGVTPEGRPMKALVASRS